MGKIKKKGRKEVQVVVSDDDDDGTGNIPDPHSKEFYQDEVDEFHELRDKISLEKGRDLEPAGFSSDEEEIMAIDDEGDNINDEEFEDDEEIQEYERRLNKFRSRGYKDEMGSDLEEEEKGDGLPDEKAWGSARSKFYGGDVDSDDDIDFSGSEPDTALLEEKEAMALQKKMAEQLQDQDFDLEIFKTAKKLEPTSGEKGKEKIVKDLSKLSKREKLQLLKKESPELLELIEDYKVKMIELSDRLAPLHSLIQKGDLPSSSGTDYIKAKFKLYLNYCTNISFYLMLKARQTPVHSHPVINRLVQYRNLIKQLEASDVKMKEKIDAMIQSLQKGDKITSKECLLERNELSKKKNLKNKSSQKTERQKLSQLLDEDMESEGPKLEGCQTRDRKRGKAGQYETKAEKQALANYELMKGGKRKGRPEMEEEDDDEMEHRSQEETDFYEEKEEEKRGITREMLKNRGLTPHRNKKNRNPRVKHRLKWEKAKVRRKGQIRLPTTELFRYGGEISGIRAGIKRSTRLK